MMPFRGGFSEREAKKAIILYRKAQMQRKIIDARYYRYVAKKKLKV